MIKEKIEQLLNAAAKKAGYGEVNLVISFSALPEVCDFQCNGCFALAKVLGKNPLEIAENIVKNLEKSENFEFFALKPAFINVKLTDKCLAEIGQAYLKDELCGVKKHEKSEFVILDYGGANVAKALHVGHLRPAIIGESLKRLYKLLGDKVISDVHLGDWGLQMGLTELQLFEEGKLDGYFGKGENKPLTLDDLNEAYPKASLRKNQEEDFKQKAEEWTLKIQRREQPYFEIYQVIRELSVKEIKVNYSRLGAEFDLWYGESTADEYCKQAVEIIRQKGLLKESEGALVVEVAKEGENVPVVKNGQTTYLNPMPPCLIQKSNGAVLYATTDIATILMRNKLYKNVDRIEYVTDGRQKLHFTQVFRTCKLSGIAPENQQLIHIVNGTMNGRDGKPFKTRSGDTIKLEDIIKMLSDSAMEKLKANGVEGGQDMALKIGVGAMKFGDLINNVSKDYVFDLDKFMAFEGKTGPYIQYTVVRINSILSKVSAPVGEIIVNNDEVRNIIKAIIKLNSSYEVCYKDKSLNNLCASVFDLASAFSTFYNEHNVANEKDACVQASYIALLTLVKRALMQALDVLAIEVPERM